MGSMIFVSMVFCDQSAGSRTATLLGWRSLHPVAG